jgi:hypothetical protein
VVVVVTKVIDGGQLAKMNGARKNKKKKIIICGAGK